MAALNIADKFDIPLVVNNPTSPFSVDDEKLWFPLGDPVSVRNVNLPKVPQFSLSPPPVCWVNARSYFCDNCGLNWAWTLSNPIRYFEAYAVIVNTAIGFDFARDATSRCHLLAQ